VRSMQDLSGYVTVRDPATVAARRRRTTKKEGIFFMSGR
jgi:hypothetical protein